MTNGDVKTLHQLLLNETRRRLFEEGVTRIEKCLNMLDEGQIWYRPNEQSNSIGNLVLHLCGNVRQWIVSGLGNAIDTRQRQQEFEEQGPLSTQILLERLHQVMNEVEKVLIELTPNDLLQTKTIQGFQETGLSVLVHVIEHFSYHVGQITYITKWLTNESTDYYADLNLEIKNLAS
jgi:uncharacterized damage-inducible protein DinB